MAWHPIVGFGRAARHLWFVSVCEVGLWRCRPRFKAFPMFLDGTVNRRARFPFRSVGRWFDHPAAAPGGVGLVLGRGHGLGARSSGGLDFLPFPTRAHRVAEARTGRGARPFGGRPDDRLDTAGRHDQWGWVDAFGITANAAPGFEGRRTAGQPLAAHEKKRPGSWFGFSGDRGPA